MILGVSPDDVESHRRFKEKFALPFTLVADTDRAICEAYGVWVEKEVLGEKVMGVTRTTFLIAPDGRIARVFEKVKSDLHVPEVEAALAALR